MKALFWILLIGGVYFLLRLFDPDGKKQVHEQPKPESKPKPVPQPKPAPQPRVFHNPNAPVQKLNFFCVKDKGYHVSVWPNVQGYQNLDYIEFEIAGISHYKSTAMKHLGESLAVLAAEPDNPYDPNAIRILTSDWQLLGYVPRDMTEEIRRHTSLSCPCFIFIGYRPDKDTFFTDAYIECSLSKS